MEIFLSAKSLNPFVLLSSKKLLEDGVHKSPRCSVEDFLAEKFAKFFMLF